MYSEGGREMRKPLYCVVARNRLTGEREIVSRGVTKDEAEDIRIKYTNFRGTKKPYAHPKVVPYNPQMSLFNQ